jgi:hypothetical protein
MIIAADETNGADVQNGTSADGQGENEVISRFQAICCRRTGEGCLTSHELQALRRALQLGTRLSDLCGLRCAR